MTPLQRQDFRKHLELEERWHPLNVHNPYAWEQHLVVVRIIGALVGILTVYVIWVVTQ